jgi:hypothetical protein
LISAISAISAFNVVVQRAGGWIRRPDVSKRLKFEYRAEHLVEPPSTSS